MERSFLRLGGVTLVVASSIAVTACGSDASNDTNGASTSSSSSSGTSGSSGSSGSEAVSPIVSGSNGSDGKAGEIVSCTFDESLAMDSANMPSVAVVAQPTGVAVFIAREVAVGKGFESNVRRYLLKSANPCVLERDQTYVGAEKAVGIAVDAAQRVWGTFPSLARIHPAPTLGCAGARGGASDIAVAPSGEHGFGRFLDPETKKESLFHFTSDGTLCTMIVLERSPAAGSGYTDVAVDHLGRAHVLGFDNSTDDLSVSVYDKTGAELGKYAESSKPVRLDGALSRCFEGTCLQDFDRVIRYDASLKPVKEYSRSAIGNGKIIAGDTTGPVFVGGVVDNKANGSRFRIALDILAAP